MASGTRNLVYPDHEVSGDGSSWLPPEPSNGDELADERTRVMTTAAAAASQPAKSRPDEASWLPADEPAAAPSEAPTSWLPDERPEEPAPPNTEASAPVALTTDRRQALAVEAYCRELCPPEAASAAAGEALGSYTGRGDEELLRHTRAIAGKHAIAPPRRGLRRKLPAECAATPGRLAARANGDIAPEEREELERHLDSCINCQAMELRSRRADRAYASIAGIALAREEPVFRPAPALEPEPVVAPVEALAAAPIEQAAAAPAEDAATSDWIPTAAAIASPAVANAVTEASPAGYRRRRRPSRAVAYAMAGAVAIAAVIAVVALSGGHSHHPTVASTTTPAPTTTPATPTKTHHKAVKRAATHHATAKKPAVHHAAAAASSTPAVASVNPTPSSTSSAPVSQQSAPVSSAPSSSSSSGSSSSSSGSSSSSSPSVSISQPGLGNAPASQGIGK